MFNKILLFASNLPEPIAKIFPAEAGDAVYILHQHTMKIAWSLLFAMMLISAVLSLWGLMAGFEIDEKAFFRRLITITLMMVGYGWMFSTILGFGTSIAGYFYNQTNEDIKVLALKYGTAALTGASPTPTPAPGTSPKPTPTPAPGTSPKPTPVPGTTPKPADTKKEGGILSGTITTMGSLPSTWSAVGLIGVLSFVFYVFAYLIMTSLWKIMIVSLFCMGPIVLIFGIMPGWGDKVLQNFVQTLLHLSMWPIWWSLCSYFFWISIAISGLKMVSGQDTGPMLGNGFGGAVEAGMTNAGLMPNLNITVDVLASLVAGILFLATPSVISAMFPFSSGMSSLQGGVTGALSTATMGIAAVKSVGGKMAGGASGGGGGKFGRTGK